MVKWLNGVHWQRQPDRPTFPFAPSPTSGVPASFARLMGLGRNASTESALFVTTCLFIAAIHAQSNAPLLPPLEELPRQSPLAQLPIAIRLPSQATLKPKTIGLAACQRPPKLELLGGATACDAWDETGSNSRFELTRDRRDLAGRTHLVRLQPSGIELAKVVWNSRKELEFRWLPTAEAAPHTSTLCNCVLVVRDRADAKSIALRKTQSAAGARIQWRRDTSTSRFEIEDCPNINSLHLEITGASGIVPGFFTDQSEVAMPRGASTLKFGDGAYCQMHFGAFFNRSNATLQVGISPKLVVAFIKDPQPWSVDRIDRLSKQMRDITAEHAAKIKYFQAAMNRSKSKATRTSHQKSITRLSRELRRLRGQLALLQQAKRWIGQSKGPVVHFRIYRTVDGHELDLLRTGA